MLHSLLLLLFLYYGYCCLLLFMQAMLLCVLVVLGSSNKRDGKHAGMSFGKQLKGKKKNNKKIEKRKLKSKIKVVVAKSFYSTCITWLLCCHRFSSSDAWLHCLHADCCWQGLLVNKIKAKHKNKKFKGERCERSKK